jgi:hypothetical protein
MAILHHADNTLSRENLTQGRSGRPTQSRQSLCVGRTQ